MKSGFRLSCCGASLNFLKPCVVRVFNLLKYRWCFIRFIDDPKMGMIVNMLDERIRTKMIFTGWNKGWVCQNEQIWALAFGPEDSFTMPNVVLLLDAQYKDEESDSVFLLVQNLGSFCGGIWNYSSTTCTQGEAKERGSLLQISWHSV